MHWIDSDNRLLELTGRQASTPVSERIQMDEIEIQELRQRNRKALELVDEAIESLDRVRLAAQEVEERHQEELRRAESRRPGIFRALFQ